MNVRLDLSALILLAASAVGLNSCGLTDTAATPAAITNVSQYYFPLASVGTNVAYERTVNGVSDTVRMTMQGRDPLATASSIGRCYSVNLSNDQQFHSDMFFVVNDSEAYTLGNVSCGVNGDTWLDLKSPLTVGQQWAFNTGNVYYPQMVTATVLRRGVQLKMPNAKVFDDVTEVRYIDSESDTTTKWFARGVGLVYATSTHVDTYLGSETRILESH
jgi:hypothetical protein